MIDIDEKDESAPEPASNPTPDPSVDVDYVPDFHREIEHMGETYVYNFRLCSIQQVLLAKSVFDLAATMRSKPPRDFKALELSGQMDYVIKALAYVMTRKLPGGVVEKFERRQAREVTAKWLAELPAEQWNTIQEIKSDFFDRAGIVDFDSVLQLMPLLQNSEVAAYAQANSSTPNESGNSSTTSND